MNAAIVKRSHTQWDSQEVSLAFGLTEVKKLPILDHWQKTAEQMEITPFEQETLNRLRLHLIDRGRKWNEEELKIFFIGPLTSLINFDDQSQYKMFAERDVSATIEVGEMGSGSLFESELGAKIYELSGDVDWLLARGDSKPMAPYFFIHEYKRGFGKNAKEPFGQLLSAMVAARFLNLQKKLPDRPLFGTVVSGQTWWFVVLEANQFVVSIDYNATHENSLNEIFKMTAAVQRLILLES